MKIFHLTIVSLLLLACEADTPPAEPGTRTPLSLEGITVSVEARTEAAATFFEEGDLLIVNAIPLASGAMQYSTWYRYTSGAWALNTDQTPLYLEDVYANGAATHTFTAWSASAGQLHPIQFEAVFLHKMDAIEGPLTLDAAARTLTAGAPLKRLHTRMRLTVSPGQVSPGGSPAWDADAFRTYMQRCTGTWLFVGDGGIGTTSVKPLALPAADGTPTYHYLAIAPPQRVITTQGTPVFQLQRPDGAPVLSLTLDAPLPTPQAGQEVVVGAILTPDGLLTAVNVTLEDWQEGTLPTGVEWTAE